MAHFIVHLPENKIGDVRCGTVRKKAAPINFFKRASRTVEIKTGYNIRVFSDRGHEKDYWMYKSKTGEWSLDPDGAVKLQEEIVLNIQKAIVQKELEALS